MIQYEGQGPGTRCHHRLFSGASDRHSFVCHLSFSEGRHPSLSSRPAAVLFAFAQHRVWRTRAHRQRKGHAALLSGGRTSPSVMLIGSPHEPASGGNENSTGGALPRSLLAIFTRRHRHSERAFQAHRSRMLHMLACLPLLPDTRTLRDRTRRRHSCSLCPAWVVPGLHRDSPSVDLVRWTHGVRPRGRPGTGTPPGIAAQPHPAVINQSWPPFLVPLPECGRV